MACWEFRKEISAAGLHLASRAKACERALIVKTKLCLQR